MPVGRMTRRGTLPTVLLSAVALVGTGNTPAVADSGVSLPISSASDIVVDSVYQHLFISDPADSSVLVTDYDGSVVTEIPSQSGAAGLAMDEDFVYVALPSANAISLINRSTLQETTRRSTGIGIAPQHLTFAAGKLWFGYDTSLQGKLGSLDRAGWYMALNQDGNHSWKSAPILASSSGAPGMLAAGATGQSPTEVQVYDVSSGTAVSTAYASDPGSEGSGNLSDMALTLDGKDLVTAGASPQYAQVLRTSDLSADGNYTTVGSPNAVAISLDGRVATGMAGPTSTDLSVFLPGNSTAVQNYDLSDDLVPAGLTWDPFNNRLFALTQPSGSGPVTLHVETPAKADTTMTLQVPATAKRNKPLTLNGTLSSPIAIPDATDVSVTRADSASPNGINVGTASVSSLNTFTINDIPPVGGVVTYTVTYTGDTAHNGTTATATVQVK
ncbi:YncE family protein [Streptomyces sp. NPDC101149]|uniref:YncE family protein n=1 Tax=Streptomyces sp. NPDC101149 TaxID=3366113 RepID=UPI003802DB28